ncbi:CdaR family protein [Staphylococcus massiliensis]|uniref:YbbR-like domain-containing protein n=1 Tax=Staphylococcus massiliensis S46 TaxID=1229783 RepID=K9AEF1_9STAP|nr:CdaR family protein [Staphylococcus massiliensis]EKU45709.1 hypothetical protein C273_10917 [Staphylococcus massiliensis S46]MCG3400218.1 YbbR-like domain-containing protein [Staphylococcus massiliensis]MCG3402785.1 YbbR-like domain-containing protein [Staphylococcus massiliensis]PNZ96904.1 hypothetical protein CD133_11375 [Staphylococcus massiliensis CCUG 55927]
MLDSKWGLRFVSLILAVFFFISVNNVFGNMFNTDELSNDSAHTISNVPTEVQYNNKSYYVSGVPKKVDVVVTGPQSQILQAEKTQDFKVVADLTEVKPGKKRVEFQVKGLSKDINAKVKPKAANVSIEKRVSKTMKVEPDVSSNHINPNYQISHQEVNPKSVKVTGGEHQIDKIAYLKANFKESPNVSDNTTDIGEVSAFDRNLNKLDVIIEPKDVKLSVEVEPYSKKIKLEPELTGKPKDNKEIKDVDLDEEEVEVFGDRNKLQSLESIKAEVDVSDIGKDDTKKVKLKLPDGVKKATPEEVFAKVKVK